MREIRKILICVDGEEHSVKAEDYAIALAANFGATLIALYVVSPLLKKFTNEIYAVNRDECRAHLDRSLESEGRSALSAFNERARLHSVPVESRILYGMPEGEIVNEAASGNYDLVVLGGKVLGSWMARFESCNLPEKVFRDIPVPVLFVR
jgi:nucleotide-binding universal stress UspA family protein